MASLRLTAFMGCPRLESRIYVSHEQSKSVKN
jgi:hypothetical protein